MSAAAPLPELEITLDEPITFLKDTVTSIILREPKAKEVRDALAELGTSNSPDALYRYQIALVANVSGRKKQEIEQLPIRTLKQAYEYLESFLSPDGQ